MLKSVEVIKKHRPNFIPTIGIILGSGLGQLAEQIENPTVISYADIPGFPVSTVAGHAGQMILGELGNMPVVCLKGRVHGYEGATPENFKTFIRTLKLLGCETLLITNASGSLREDVGPGELVLINDHINLQHRNPLMGPNDDEFGPRFFAMDNAYDPILRKRFHKVAQELNINLTEGVYVGVTGPVFETPAEIQAFRILGGHVVGMSTVPEVIVARHCGLRIATVAAITNFGAGMQAESLSHEGTLHYGQLSAEKLSRLIIHVVKSLKHDPC